jgi:hypothetical protein
MIHDQQNQRKMIAFCTSGKCCGRHGKPTSVGVAKNVRSTATFCEECGSALMWKRNRGLKKPQRAGLAMRKQLLKHPQASSAYDESISATRAFLQDNGFTERLCVSEAVGGFV